MRLGSVLGGQPGGPGEGLAVGGAETWQSGSPELCVQPLLEGLLFVFDGSLSEESKSNCFVPQ